MSQSSCGHRPTFLLGRYPGEEWMAHTVGVFSALKKLPSVFRVAMIWHFLYGNIWEFQSPHPHQHVMWSVFSISASSGNLWSSRTVWSSYALLSWPTVLSVFPCACEPFYTFICWSVSFRSLKLQEDLCVWLVLGCQSSLYTGLKIKSFVRYICKCFLLGCELPIFVSFEEQMLFVLMKCNR